MIQNPDRLHTSQPKPSQTPDMEPPSSEYRLDPNRRSRKSGYIWRGSEVVEGVVNRRFAVLHSDVFATYRRDKEVEPSRVWPLNSNCDLSGVEPRELLKAKTGYNNVVAWMSGKVDKAQGVSLFIPSSLQIRNQVVAIATVVGMCALRLDQLDERQFG